MAGFIEVDDQRRVTHHKLDQVGNDLTQVLAWCASHTEPAWVFGDGSFRCWWEDITGHHQHLQGCGPDDHQIVAGPWEADGPAAIEITPRCTCARPAGHDRDCLCPQCQWPHEIPRSCPIHTEEAG